MHSTALDFEGLFNNHFGYLPKKIILVLDFTFCAIYIIKVFVSTHNHIHEK